MPLDWRSGAELLPLAQRVYRNCRVLSQPRSIQRYSSIIRDDKVPQTAVIVRLASQDRSYGYRWVTALLRAEGFHVNLKRVWIGPLNERLLLLTRRG